MIDKSPAEWQEHHSPTEAVEVVIAHTTNGKRVKEQARRRRADSQLWATLTGPQQDAAERIRLGRVILSGAGDVRISEWEKKPRSNVPASAVEGMTQIRVDYLTWFRLCCIAKIDPEPARLIAGEGYSIADVVRERSLSRRTAKRLLVEGLEEFCTMKGWR